MAVKSDNTVWAWGHNSQGQVGDGSTVNRLVPVSASGLSGVVAVSGGIYHSLALKDDASLRSWGNNYYGQLGDGTTTQRLTPVTVIGISF